VFFPYLNNVGKSEHGLGQYKQSYRAKINASNCGTAMYGNKGCGHGVEMKSIPPSLSKV
jgi:hypothetical protein